MKNILSLCVFIFISSCALISFANDFEDIPNVTVAEVLEMPDNKLVFMQGKLDKQIFTDATGSIDVGNTFYSNPEQKIEVLARTHNTFFTHEINIITLSPL